MRFFSGSHNHPYLTAAMDNVLASRLGQVVLKVNAILHDNPPGDSIDLGLLLRRELESAGFRVRQACPHERLDMDGICHECGEDRRGG